MFVLARNAAIVPTVSRIQTCFLHSRPERVIARVNARCSMRLEATPDSPDPHEKKDSTLHRLDFRLGQTRMAEAIVPSTRKTTTPTSRRFKREECHRTKHDSIFSKWQILVGPSDWKNYLLGKDGSERYRIQNLPPISPGIYELGVAATTMDSGRELRKLEPHQIVVVYLGEADDVRTRLQHYGRAGSHLDRGHSVGVYDKTNGVCLYKGPGFFEEVFTRGWSIVFRWAPMKDKKAAEEAEARLLKIFDYAWNKIGNGSCRREDVLVKMCNRQPVSNPLSGIWRKLKFMKMQAFDNKQIGIEIDSRKPLEEVEIATDYNIRCPQVYKSGSNRPRLVLQSDNQVDDSSICGVIQADGSLCRNRPYKGKKRCPEHKGQRIKTSRLVTSEEGLALVTVKEEGTEFRSGNVTCGIYLEDGTHCMNVPPKGWKRCPEHKGQRIKPSISVTSREDLALVTVKEECKEFEREDVRCGVYLADGTRCMKAPPKGRKRCDLHKGRRIIKPTN